MSIPGTGGDPARARQLAVLLEGYGAAVVDRYRPVGRGVDGLMLGWRGVGADAFFNRMQNQRPQIAEIEDEIATINRALGRFADALDVVAQRVAEAQRREETLPLVERWLVRRGTEVLLSEEGRQVRTLWVRAHAEADLARAELRAALDSLALAGREGPDGRGGERIVADHEADGARQHWGHLVDWAGDMIRVQYLWGDGRPIVIDNDPAWSNYMTGNESLTAQAEAWIHDDARRAIDSVPERGELPLWYRQSLELDENGYGTGYELLHGANLDRGGFEVSGRQTVTPVPDGGYEVHVKADYTWHDVQDPNPKYTGDSLGEVVAELRTAGDAEPYDIDITWTREAVLRFDADGRLLTGESYGWPLTR